MSIAKTQTRRAAPSSLLQMLQRSRGSRGRKRNEDAAKKSELHWNTLTESRFSTLYLDLNWANQLIANLEYINCDWFELTRTYDLKIHCKILLGCLRETRVP